MSLSFKLHGKHDKQTEKSKSNISEKTAENK
jgi:hypothetical protein